MEGHDFVFGSDLVVISNPQTASVGQINANTGNDFIIFKLP